MIPALPLPPSLTRAGAYPAYPRLASDPKKGVPGMNSSTGLIVYSLRATSNCWKSARDVDVASQAQPFVNLASDLNESIPYLVRHHYIIIIHHSSSRSSSSSRGYLPSLNRVATTAVGLCCVLNCPLWDPKDNELQKRTVGWCPGCEIQLWNKISIA